MDSSSFSHCNWNNLPNEIKVNIIHRIDRNSRLSLRTCSTSDYQLVESIPYRTIQKLYLWNDDDEWHLDITRNMYGSEVPFVFDDFQDFQNKLEEVIESCECIDLLKAFQTETSTEIKLTKQGKLLKVRKLIFGPNSADALNIIAQIEPSHLKKLLFDEYSTQQGILATPQALQAQYLNIYKNSVTDDQLLEMESPKVFLEETFNITMAGINLYLKKCLLNLEKKPINFRYGINDFPRGGENDLSDFYFDGLLNDLLNDDKFVSNRFEFPKNEWKFILYSNSEKYQLKLKYCSFYIEAKTICQNRPIERLQVTGAQNPFKSVDYVGVSLKRLTINEKRTASVQYLFDSQDEMENKLTELLNNLDYIKNFRIEYTFPNRVLRPPTNQITVGKLSIESGDLSPDFLRKIEPVYLKEIEVEGYSHTGRCYDMPQLIHAQKIDITNCNINDQQLLNLNAIQVNIHTGNHENLTDSGINMYIKKILTKLNLHDYNFCISSPETFRIPGDWYKDLDVFNIERIYHDVVKYIVNSNFPEFKLELTERVGSISGKRIKVADVQ